MWVVDERRTPSSELKITSGFVFTLDHGQFRMTEQIHLNNQIVGLLIRELRERKSVPTLTLA